MTARVGFLCFLALLIGCVYTDARSETLEFSGDENRALYQTLIAELRCLVCQNQNLADSNADLAKDLRSKTYRLVEAGKSRDYIVDYMVDRYGDFIHYRPPLKPSTLFLWLSPFILFIVIVCVSFVRIKRSNHLSKSPVSMDDLELAKRYLKRSNH